MSANQSGQESQWVDKAIQLSPSLLTRLLILAVVGSLFTYTSFPETIHIGVTVPALMLAGVLAVYRNSSLRIPRYALLMYLITWFVYVPHALTPSPNLWALVRLPLFMIGSFILLFVVPNVISPEQFHRIVFYVSAGVTLLGLPTYLVGTYDIAGLEFSLYPVPATIPVFGATFQPFSSFLANPNPYGYISGLGVLAGFGVCTSSRRRVNIGLLAVVVLGLCLSLSRASLLGWAAGVSLFAAYQYVGRRFVIVLLCSGLMLSAYMIAAVVGMVPDVFGVGELFLYDRLDYWAASIRALDGHELFGIGFGGRSAANVPSNLHNGYIFVLLTRGIIGLAAQITLLGLAYRHSIFNLTDLTAATSLSMLTMVLVVTFFESIILFGFGGLPVLATLVVGFAIQPKQVRNSTNRG